MGSGIIPPPWAPSQTSALPGPGAVSPQGDLGSPRGHLGGTATSVSWGWLSTGPWVGTQTPHPGKRK